MFKKGTQVWVLQSWDNKGTVRGFQAVVDSCGKQQMHLRLSDGKMTKSREYVSHINRWEAGYTLQSHVIVATAEEARAYGLRLAANIITHERAAYTRCLADTDAGEGYLKSIQKSMDELHEPRFEDHTVKVKS